MRLGSIEQKIFDITNPSVENMGYSIVRIKLHGEGKGRTLQFMIDRMDGKRIKVEDCTDVSHMVSALLEVDDPISGAYNLEMSSPGVDRPLTRAEDFKRYAGFTAKIETDVQIEKRKRFKGEILSLENVDGAGFIKVVIDDGTEYTIPFERIEKAKLVVTDALLKAYENGEIV